MFTFDNGFDVLTVFEICRK